MNASALKEEKKSCHNLREYDQITWLKSIDFSALQPIVTLTVLISNGANTLSFPDKLHKQSPLIGGNFNFHGGLQ